MLRKTPLAAALMTIIAAPIAAPLYAQTAPQATPQTAPAAAADNAAPVEGATLPAVRVTGQADSSGDFQAEHVERRREGADRVARHSADGHGHQQGGARNRKARRLSRMRCAMSRASRSAAAEGGQIGNNINLRGFTARTDIYLDGFRDRGQYYRDTFDLESIDVLYGPSSMLFGRGSTGGVINQVSKKATLQDSRDVSAMVGTDDRYRTHRSTSNQPISDTVRRSASTRSARDLGSTRDVMKSKDYGIAPEVRFGIGTPTESRSPR